MIKRRRMIRILGKACYGIGLMLLGAILMTFYLAHKNPVLDHPLRELRASLFFDFWILLLLGNYLNPTLRRPSRPYQKPTGPDGSGVMVIIATGLAGGDYFLWDRQAGGSYMAAGVTLCATLIIATLLWRFSTKHAGEIGEARFVTNGQQ